MDNTTTWKKKMKRRRSWSNRKKGTINWVYVVGEQDATAGCLVLVQCYAYPTALNKETCKNAGPRAGSVAQAKLSPGERWGRRLLLGPVSVASGCLLQVQARVKSLVWYQYNMAALRAWVSTASNQLLCPTAAIGQAGEVQDWEPHVNGWQHRVGISLQFNPPGLPKETIIFKKPATNC